MKNWLKEEIRNNTGLNFEVFDISENSEITDTVKSIIAEELIRAFRNPEGLKKQFENADKEDLSNYIRNHLFSPPNKGFDILVRIGDWGEVFTGLYLVNIKDNIIPFYKIRFKSRNDKSVQTLDLLTFNENNKHINFNEIKTRSSKLSNKKDKPNSKYEVAIDAYKELKTEFDADLPLIYNFITRILYDNEQYELADKFDQFYQNEKCKKKSNIFLIFDNKHWNDEVLNYLNSYNIELKDLCVFVIKVKDLRELIDSTYNLTVQIAEKIVYG